MSPVKQRLNDLEAPGLLKRVIELVPVANPVGPGSHGAFRTGQRQEFQPFLRKTRCTGGNITLIRQTMAEVLDDLLLPPSQLEGLHRLLLCQGRWA